MNKQELRRHYKQERKKISEKEIEEKSLAIANQVLNLPIWNATFYHVFLPIARQKEVKTDYLLNILNGKDKQVVVSKSNFDNFSLNHFLLTDALLLKENAWGIPEPVESNTAIEIPSKKIEVVFVPLLAYDKKGNRIGYGKGFYDRFLADCKPNTLKVGVSLFPPEEKLNDVTETDIRLDYCVTPEKIYAFSD